MIEVLQVSAPGLAYIVLGGFVVLFSMVSLLVKERLYINEVVLGTLFGILMGPHVANIFDPRAWGNRETVITLEVMRIVLATGLFAIGVELPQSYLADHAKGLMIMVVPTMAFGWVVVAAVLWGLMPNLNFISCLAIAACLTPTDPIICAAIVGGKYAMKHVPTNLRRILSAESAANDGMAYPFLTIALYLTVEPTTRAAIGRWFLIGWLYQVILGVVLGGLIGLGFCKLMKYTHRKGFIDRESYVAQYLALAFLTIGVCSTLGSDDLLGAFAAGSAISWDGHFNTQIENEVFSSVIDLVLNCACFVYIGAWLPFDSFNTPELGIVPWKLVVLFLVILAIRRIPSMLLLYHFIPEIVTWREALFSGHFGPMGVGAVFISTLAVIKLPAPVNPPENQEQLLALTLQPIVSFVVLGSIFIHGLSIPFFTLSRRVGSRTLSLTQTFTSRQGNGPPDWLLAVRSAPPKEEGRDIESGVAGHSRGPSGSGNVSSAQSLRGRSRERGRSRDRSEAAAHEDPETGAPVISGQAAAEEQPSYMGPGVASMGLEDPEAQKRARRLSDPEAWKTDDNAEPAGEPDIAAPTGAQTPKTVRFPDNDAGHPDEQDFNLPSGLQTPRTVRFPDEDGLPSGLQTPRTVRFPDEDAGQLRKRLQQRLDNLPVRPQSAQRGMSASEGDGGGQDDGAPPSGTQSPNRSHFGTGDQ